MCQRGKYELCGKFQSEDGCERVVSRDGGGVPSEMERLPGEKNHRGLIKIASMVDGFFYDQYNKGIGDAGSTADFRML